MYDFIRGVICRRQVDYLVIECHDLGYRVRIAPEHIDQFPAVDQEALVYTSQVIREDSMTLYGFPGQDQRSLFELLMTVSGIGPKVALAIIGAMAPGDFGLAILAGDIKKLTSVKGIGRKGAERLILEMKDKLKGFDLPLEPAPEYISAPQANGVKHNEAISALVVLGYSATEAGEAVRAVEDPELAVEEIIRLALRQLVR